MRLTRLPVASILFVICMPPIHAADASTMVTSHYAAAKVDTAAHRTLKFGTRLAVVNPRNGKSLTLVVRDRGPFIRGRQLDISNQAAVRLGFGRSGVLSLQVRILRD